MKTIAIALLLVTTFVYPQDHVLVSPDGEVIPLTEGMVLRDVIREHRTGYQASDLCSNHGTFGYPFEQYPISSAFGVFHQDVVATWFEAPANGIIEKVYWVSPFAIDSLATPVSLRLFKSNIREGSGPGYNGLPAPRTCWGYYRNANDTNQGISPYRNEATDTHWVKTIADSTWDPLGEEMWGLGGFRTHLESSARVVGVSLYVLGYAPEVSKGEPFFICLRDDRAPNDHTRASLGASNTGVPIPSHAWKFYQENPGVAGGNCAGWQARGELNFNIWYTMALNFQPPELTLLSGHPLFDTDSLKICLLKYCTDADLDSAGIAYAELVYRINNEAPRTIRAETVGDSSFCATLPGQQANSLVSVASVIIAPNGTADTISKATYPVIGLSQNGYHVDTAAAFHWIELDGEVDNLPPSAWFLPGDAGLSLSPLDDGIAGPIDLGFSFSLFGSTARFAWIGVNGGIALSASPTDTIDLSNNSTFGTFSIPAEGGGTPKNFIAPLWNDLSLVPADFNCDSGRVFVRADSAGFVVEWVSLNSVNQAGDCGIAFELILNRIDSSVTFLYLNLGTGDLDRTSLIGMESDSAHWLLVNFAGEPQQLRARYHRAYRFKPKTITSVQAGHSDVLNSYSLNQNYPNPFNSSSALSYSIVSGSWVKLDIFDLLGRDLATLVDEWKSPGHYTTEWNAGNVPSGVYYYRLTTNNIIQTKKMILMR